MIADKSLADPNLDFADFTEGGLNYAVEPDGRINSLPFNVDPWVVYYNKEIFEAKGVAYPKTFAEMADAAAKLNDPGKGIAGFVGRGLKNANVPVWSSFLLGYGGGFIDAKGKLTTDTPEAIEAAKMYQLLLGKYGPAGVAGYNWNESQTLFMQGKAAMWLDGIGFAQPLEDPTKSRIVGKVGYGVMPVGPEEARVGVVRRRRRHLVVSARSRALRSSTCNGRRTSRCRRGCCRPPPGRRCANRRTCWRSNPPISRCRSNGSSACSRRRASRSRACR